MASAEPITREELFELAASPIGGPEAKRAAAAHRPGRDKTPAILKEAGKRAAKIWLPRGKRRTILSAGDPAAQTDLEDAVEAAGGKRGGGRELAAPEDLGWRVVNDGAGPRIYGVARKRPGSGHEWAKGADGRYRRFGNRTAAQRIADQLNADTA